MLLDEYFRKRGIRDQVQLATATLQPILMPNAGGPGSQWVAAQLYERDIVHSTGRRLIAVEPGVAHFEDWQAEFDLMLAVPPHGVPDAVAAAGLTADHGWIEVDRATLATSYPGVYAIGDVTMIKLSNGLPLPKAGVIAEREGQRVGAAIAAQLNGEPEPPPFAGEGICFVETGAGSAALVDGKFFADPEPDVQLVPATPENAERKRRFETERLDAWFGL
jgi:sulfide:quinone oxidoreductase